jgi:protein TonB
MALTLPLSTAILVTLLYTVPEEEGTALRQPRIARRGPMKVVPQLDIDTDRAAEERLTSAPAAMRPADFIAIDIDYEVDPESPERLPDPVRQRAVGEDRKPIFTEDDLAREIRTTSLPVLAEAEVEVIHLERPVYPRKAVELNIEGTVNVIALVDEFGRVSQAYAFPPRQLPFLEDAAVAAVERYLFKPYVVEGVATAFWVRIPFLFRLL